MTPRSRSRHWVQGRDLEVKVTTLRSNGIFLIEIKASLSKARSKVRVMTQGQGRDPGIEVATLRSRDEVQGIFLIAILLLGPSRKGGGLFKFAHVSLSSSCCSDFRQFSHFVARCPGCPHLIAWSVN